MEKKIRVKCANCGMVYDIYRPEFWTTDPIEPKGKCPKCGSNAFNVVGEGAKTWE